MDKSNPSSSQSDSPESQEEIGLNFSIKDKLQKELNITDSTEFDATQTANFDMVTHINQTRPNRDKIIPNDIVIKTEPERIKSVSTSINKTFSSNLSERYSTSKTVGQGGMGLIRSVTDKNLKRTLAMKILSTKFVGDENITNAFIEEAKITAQLQHPNIIPVHDIGLNDEDGSYFTL